MAKSAVLKSRRSTRNDFGWPKLISFLNLLCLIIVIIGSQLSARPDRFKSFPSYTVFSVFYIIGFAAWAFACVEIAHKPSLGTSSTSVLLVVRSIESGSEQKKSAISVLLVSILIICINIGHMDRKSELVYRLYSSLMFNFGNMTLLFYQLWIRNLSGCQRIEPQNVGKLEEDDKPDRVMNPEEDCKKLASSTNICQQKTSTPQQSMPSPSQHPQKQQNDTAKPSKQTMARVFEREELITLQQMDLDDNTDNFCSDDHERTTNELQRTLSEHCQQQKQDSHHPEPNTPTCEQRTRRWKRYNPDTQTTPQHTHKRSKRQRVSNDQRQKLFYMDSGAAYHSTFDPSVIKSYPAHLNIKPPIQNIQGFGGSTVLVTGYGYIDGPGGKLKDVLLLPDSTANLMCLGQLTRDYPVKVVFYKDKFWIEGLHNGERIGEGHRKDGNHYVVDRFHPDSLLINKRKPSKKKARQYIVDRRKDYNADKAT